MIVFGANSTSLLFHLSRSFARTIGPGDEVVVTRLDHDANVRPWVLAARDAGATRRPGSTCGPTTRPSTSTRSTRRSSDRPRLVAFTLASNAVGTVTPAADLVARAKAVGAIVAVDGVHVAQHRSIDLDALGADIVTISPYKVFGPHMGMVAATPEVLDALGSLSGAPRRALRVARAMGDGHPEPRGAWRARRRRRLPGRDRHRRATAGPVDATRRAAVVAAFDAIGAHERALARSLPRGHRRASTTCACSASATSDRLDERTPTFALRVGDQHPRETAKALAERGIYVWDGHYYAIELYERLGLLDTGGAVRIGFCHYHSLDEVDRVLEALADLS